MSGSLLCEERILFFLFLLLDSSIASILIGNLRVSSLEQEAAGPLLLSPISHVGSPLFEELNWPCDWLIRSCGSGWFVWWNNVSLRRMSSWTLLSEDWTKTRLEVPLKDIRFKGACSNRCLKKLWNCLSSSKFPMGSDALRSPSSLS